MLKFLVFGILLIFLSACSHVSKVCDKDGVCLEIWQYVSASSTITISQLRTKMGNPVIGTTITTTTGGIVSYVDPLAVDTNTLATQARVVKAW